MRTPLLVIIATLLFSCAFAQSKKAVHKKPLAAVPDSVAANQPASTEIAWDVQTGKFTYPSGVSDAEKINKLEAAVNTNYQAYVQLLTKKQNYINAQRETAQQDMEEARAIIQQLQAQVKQLQEAQKPK